MGIFTNITSRLARRRELIVGPKDEVLRGQQLLDFGVNVNNRNAMNLTAFFAGIRIIAENVASLPKEVKKFDAGTGYVSDPRHQAFHAINIRPNSYTNVFDFWECIATWVIGWGDAYAIIKDTPDGIELHQAHPSGVDIRIVNGRKYYKVQMADPDLSWLNGIYSDEEILHFMLITTDGIHGLNPVIANAIALGKALATEKFAAEFFRKGGNIRAVLETEGNLGDEDYKRFTKHWAESANNYDTPLLEYGIKYKPLSVNPVAAQLIQSETLSIQDIARILNIPPHLLGELSHATYSNIEHQTIQFVKYTLRPLVKRLEVELEAKLFLPREIGRYSVKFVLDGLLRGDTQARSTYYHNAILDGYMSRNEVREIEGLERKDGLDTYLYPLNTGKVGEEEENDDSKTKE